MMKSISIRPVHLLFLLAFLQASITGAQVFSFDYRESVTSDYSGLMQAGTRSNVKNDSMHHKGEMQVHYLPDSVLFITIKTSSFQSTLNPTDLPTTVSLFAWMDDQYRVRAISLDENVNTIAPILRTWLGEINFILPPHGQKIETKLDGSFTTDYVIHRDGSPVVSMKKINTVFNRIPSSRQAILVKQHDWVGRFHSVSKHPGSISLEEHKQQVLGRKTLACIWRSLKVEAKDEMQSSVIEPVDVAGLTRVDLYPRLAESERRLRMAHSLLGQQTPSSLLELLKTAEGLSGEQQFRLKSMFRSALILDSASANLFSEEISKYPLHSISRDIIESAFIESNTNAGNQYLNTELARSGKNYVRLKQLLVAASVANAFTGETARILLDILKKATDEDTKNMITLALSNFAFTIKKQDGSSYQKIMSGLMQPYKTNVRDTLQYLYIIGNAGDESELNNVVSIMHSSPEYKDEAVFALRNMGHAVADSLVFDYLLNTKGASREISNLLAGRKITSEFASGITDRIIAADAAADSSFFPAFQFLLDHAYETTIDLRPFKKQELHMELYRKELEDYERESSLCSVND